MRRLRSERGTAIITAIALMTAMIAVGLAAYAFVDGQQSQAASERQRESSFNFSEAALNTEAFILSRQWPGSSNGAYPEYCDQDSAPLAYCPQPAQLAASYGTPDYAAGTKWRTEVRDDVSGQFYDDAVRNTPYRYDQNGDKRLWARADAWVRDRHLAVVALIEIEERTEELPQRAVIAGRFLLTPNGNHNYVATHPDETSNHAVTVRCDPPDPPSQSDPCLGFTPDTARPQIDPPGTPAGYIGNEYVNTDALSDIVKDRLKQRATADGTYYTSCPSDAQLTGKVVWVTGCPSPPIYQGTPDYNSEASPGILIWEDGNLTLAGNGTFWGVVYNLNLSNSTGTCVTLRGGLTVEGGVFADGQCAVDVGSNTVNINFNAKAFTTITSYGSAGVVQNSWRQLNG